MDKELLKQEIFKTISEQEAFTFLQDLLRLPSDYGQPTVAQALVKERLADMGFTLDCFPCAVDEIKDFVDFYPLPENLLSPSDIENVVATLTPPSDTAASSYNQEGEQDKANTFMIFAHIDSGRRTALMPDFESEIRDGRIYGLGSADDKGGIAMILQGVQAVLKVVPHLNKKLIVMSTIGKRGSVGTLTAFHRGYKADSAVYLHPAETGHGFREIKNYSLGQMEFNIEITGKPGPYYDELDDSQIDAVVLGAEVVKALVLWDKKRREIHRFEAAMQDFAERPNTKLNFFGAEGSELLKEDVLKYVIRCRIVFGLEETVPEVMAELKAYLAEYFRDDPLYGDWLTSHPLNITYGMQNASPASVSRDSELVKTIEKNLTSITGIKDFIYQYHPCSDIRLPIIYGETPTIGVGPRCGGIEKADEVEWMDVRDYIAGIKFVVSMIVDMCL